MVRRFGDARPWPDIWLHEGFATWSEWIWSEHKGNKTAAQWFKQLYSTSAQDIAFWTPPPGDPGTPEFLFNGTIYTAAAMTLEALREKIGDFDVLPHHADWPGEPLRHRDDRRVHRDRRTESGLELDAFFDLALPAREADELVTRAATL